MYLPFSQELNSPSIVKSAKEIHIERMRQGRERASFWEQRDLEGDSSRSYMVWQE